MTTRRFWLSLLAIVLAPPAALAQVDAGEDVVLECTSSNGTEYTLNGSVPEDDDVTFEWTTDPEVVLDNADTVTPTGIFPIGETIATLTATVGEGTPESDSATITVEDNQPPVVRVKADPSYLWPPNHEMREVKLRLRMSDRCGDGDDLEVELLDVTSNEPDNGQADGNTVDDIQGADFGTDDRSVWLRAERAGNRNGRVYTLTYRVTDGAGNETDAETKVYVPHDASDLRDLIGGNDDQNEIPAICTRPADAVAELTEIFPGLGSVRTAKACGNVCKAWTRSCSQIASGSAKCVQGEQRARALIGVAECKDSDDRAGIRECTSEVRAEARRGKRELKQEAREARDTCNAQGRRCVNACEDMFGPVTYPVDDE